MDATFLTEALATHARDCAVMLDLLAKNDGKNLRALRWYDLPLSEAASPAGQARVARWNREQRQDDEIAGNYDLVNLYFAPGVGDGLERSGATVWSCDALDSRPWFDGESEVRRALEGNAEAIIAEYQNIAGRITTHPDNASLVDRGRWTGMFLYGAKGVRNEELLARCPVMAGVLEALPLCRNFGFAMFSGMEPHTHVAPHCGSSNLRLRHHLGVDVPEPAAGRLRVGREWRSWARGRCFAFDDSFEHEVVHEGDQARVVLVVDVWHPGLTPADVRVLSNPVFGRFGKASRPKA
jgi:aspartyl/asparaginyl beta-hydroxylase